MVSLHRTDRIKICVLNNQWIKQKIKGKLKSFLRQNWKNNIPEPVGYSTYEEMSIEEHVEHYLSQGMDKKEAMKAAAADRGISKRDVYQALLEK